MANATDSLTTISADTSKPQRKIGKVDAKFLFSYYDQEGQHSAVTGGSGTEELNDKATKIILNVPIDSSRTIGAMIGINQYSSASSDNIDTRISSASRKDARSQLQVSYSKENKSRNRSYTLQWGGSVESDYLSTSVGVSWRQSSKDQNREITLNGQLYFDTWQVIFPTELRGTGQFRIDTDKRRSFSIGADYRQVLHKRLQGAVSTELVWQNGLLSTPFHRVYFSDATGSAIERLPTHRVKFPLGVRLNYFAANFILLRFNYRFYMDNWGIVGNTVSIELPIKLGSVFSIYPLYRYHTQTASDHFAPFAAHLSAEEYVTSDFDLSALDMHKFGGGIRYAPLLAYRKGKQKQRQLFKSVDLRYARYHRSDGLRAFIISFAAAFEF